MPTILVKRSSSDGVRPDGFCTSSLSNSHRLELSKVGFNDLQTSLVKRSSNRVGSNSVELRIRNRSFNISIGFCLELNFISCIFRISSSRSVINTVSFNSSGYSGASIEFNFCRGSGSFDRLQKHPTRVSLQLAG